MNFLKRIFCKSDQIEQNINLIKYSNKIIIETNNIIKNSYSIRSLEVSVLDFNISSKDLGKNIIKHLSLSKVITKITDEEIKKIDENYKRITGLKTMKARMNDALSVHISRNNNQLHFYPTINGGTNGDKKGFQSLDKKISIEYSEDYELIGKTLKLALNKCK